MSLGCAIGKQFEEKLSKHNEIGKLWPKGVCLNNNYQTSPPKLYFSEQASRYNRYKNGRLHFGILIKKLH
jgi:hypothetical protein